VRLGQQLAQRRPPDHRNAIDLFAGRWATDLSRLNPAWQSGGKADLLADPRPAQAARYLGSGGRIDGMSFLELGPLEAAHTYQLEQLGADRILAIEANGDAYLKCLKVRRIVSAGSSLKFCLLAAGEADLYPRFGRTMEWDTAAAHAVLAAAGGQVTTLDGKELAYGKAGFDNPHFVARGRP